MRVLKEPFFLTRLAMLLSGCILIAFAIASFRFIDLGLDPYGVLIVGISSAINSSYGNTVLFCNIILFILAVFLHKSCLKSIGIGTVVNMSIIGYIVDFFTDIYTRYAFIQLSFYSKICFSIFILIMFSMGASFYIMSNLGIAPYELLSISVIKFSKDKLKFSSVRVSQDVLSLAGGLYLRSTVGINTVFLSLFTGPVIAFFNDVLSNNFIKKRW